MSITIQQTKHKHLFPIIDAMVHQAVEEVEEEGSQITCRAGCTHCCHLLIEVSWEEAYELAEWVKTRPSEQQESLRERIKQNALEAKSFFSQYQKYADMVEPISDDRDLADNIYDDYFYNKKRPCPFLEDNMCSAYESRPTSCRLHLVSSPPELCAADCHDDDDYDIPDEIEELKENASHAIGAVERDGRWGHFGIMVNAVLEHLDNSEQSSERGKLVAL